MIRLSGKLPEGHRNGLDAVSRAMVADPTRRHLIVALVDCVSETTKHESDETVPTARLLSVEVITGDDRALVQAALHHAHDLRNSPSMPLGFNPVTGELTDTPSFPGPE